MTAPVSFSIRMALGAVKAMGTPSSRGAARAAGAESAAKKHTQAQQAKTRKKRAMSFSSFMEDSMARFPGSYTAKGRALFF
jgi:hypothetical protein